jgi:hypothetical protein
MTEPTLERMITIFDVEPLDCPSSPGYEAGQALEVPDRALTPGESA